MYRRFCISQVYNKKILFNKVKFILKIITKISLKKMCINISKNRVFKFITIKVKY